MFMLRIRFCLDGQLVELGMSSGQFTSLGFQILPGRSSLTVANVELLIQAIRRSFFDRKAREHV